MLREGPIPRFLHGVIEYVAGVLFIAAPFLLGFDESSAQVLSIVLGIAILILAASSEGPTGMVSQIPVTLHVALDYALVIVLVAAPFLFGFSGEAASTAFFLVLGVAHLMVTIGTRFKSV